MFVVNLAYISEVGSNISFVRGVLQNQSNTAWAQAARDVFCPSDVQKRCESTNIEF